MKQFPLGIKRHLTKLGLKATQITVLEYIFCRGKTTLQELRLKLCLSKSTLLYSLKKLKTHKFITNQKIGGKSYYTLQNSEEVDKILREQEGEDIQRIEQMYQEMKIFWKNRTDPDWAPQIIKLEGLENLIKIYEDILESACDHKLYIYGNAFSLREFVGESLDSFIKKRIQKDIYSEMISPRYGVNPRCELANRKEKRDCELLPKKDFPLEGQVFFYGNKMAFLHREKDTPVGFIIEHPYLISLLKNIFRHHKQAIRLLKQHKLIK